MRRLLPVLAFLIWVAPAHAAPTITVAASPVLGQAPLDVTLAATGDAASYHWDLGDGSQADGAVVQHRYEAGRFTATVTGTALDGTQAQASVTIAALRMTLTAPKVGTYGQRAVFKGRVFPALRGAPVSLFAGETEARSGKADKKGRFSFRVRLRGFDTYTARFGSVVSNQAAIPLRPALDVALPSSRTVGQALVLRAEVRPRGSGSLDVRVWRGGRELRKRTFAGRATLRLGTGKVTNYKVRIAVTPNGAFRGRSATVRSNVLLPYLSIGSRGPSVRVLEQRLAELRYALRGVDTYFSYDTHDAVMAFQKVNGLTRTGRVSPWVWRRLQTAHVPWARFQGTHTEVDKTRQVLFEVEDGVVRRAVHVSTGATGNTPIGRWRIYSKVPGFLPSGMFYSSFFLRGFAIHGYPSVPAYPASHGCVRTPMWIAPSLFASSRYGGTIYVYY